jgi:hypothetical protein
MSRHFRLAILSDVHYAGPQEQAEGDDYEHRVITNPLLRFALRQYRRHIWLRYPLRQNGQLDRFLATVPEVDHVIANGDYSCNTAAVGLCAAGAMESARECIGKLRARFGACVQLNFGDHELGKLRLLGSRGGMRLKSWQRGIEELGVQPFWQLELGRYVLLSCTSTLLALPVFAQDMLPAERTTWEKLRREHFAELRAAFAAVRADQRILLFCHDPTALPFLWRDEVIREKIPQIERTIIGHLHSNLYLRLSQILSGIPVLRCFGHSIQRMSTAVNEARHWKPFRVLLCPSLAGIELLNDGGYFTVELEAEAKTPAKFLFHPLKR